MLTHLTSNLQEGILVGKKERDLAIERAIDESKSVAEMMDLLKEQGIVEENEFGILRMLPDEEG